ASTRLKEIESVQQALSHAGELEGRIKEAQEAARNFAVAAANAERQLAVAKLTARLRELERCQEIAERLRAASDTANQKEEQARNDVTLAEAALAEVTSRRDRGAFETESGELARLNSELAVLQRARRGNEMQRVRDDVSRLKREADRHKELLESAIAKR